MVALTGSATRPDGASQYGPRPGTVVPYRLAQPVYDLATQAEKHGIRILGIKGDTPHLKLHGDHTPWSRGKKPGVIYAADFDDPPGFEAWLIATCKSTYDTRWIDFWNCNGSQYNAAGVRVASSGDEHLHISVALGHEATHVTLLDDYVASKTKPAPQEADMARGDDLWTLLHDGKRPGANQTAGGGVPIAWIVRELTAIKQDLAALKDLLGPKAPPQP